MKNKEIQSASTEKAEKNMENVVSTLLGELTGRVEAAPVVRQDAPHPRSEGDGDFAGLVAEINRVINPPVAVSADDVFIRTMEVVSDQVNEHGGRFSPDEFVRLCELIVDSPVLIAHDKRQLPVARNFKAEVATRDGRPWVKVWFYWPKDAAGAQDLASRIDSGVTREVSIGFEFKFPECSVCGADIRECEHQSFVEYHHPDGSVRPAHFIYREIVRVLETSLVYRGATPGTRIGTGLFFGQRENQSENRQGKPALSPAAEQSTKKAKVVDLLFDPGLANGEPIAELRDLSVGRSAPGRFVVSPLVEGLPVVALKHEDGISIFDPDQTEIGGKLPTVCCELQQKPTGDFAVFGWLVRMRMSESQSPQPNAVFTFLVELLGSLDDQDYLSHPLIENRRKVQSLFAAGTSVRALPYRWSDCSQLARTVQLIASAGGCRICPADTPILPLAHFYELRRKEYLWVQIVDRKPVADGKWNYQLALADGHDHWEISSSATSIQQYEIGRIVPVVFAGWSVQDQIIRLSDPVIQYTPVRRNQPDSVAVLQSVFNQKNKVQAVGIVTPPTPERRRAPA